MTETQSIPLVSDDVVQSIKLNILGLQSKYQNSKDGERNLLNKWFQDSVKNYIMEALVAPLLIESLNFTCIKEVKEYIHSILNKKLPKYMGIIDAYFMEVRRCNKERQFREKALEVILSRSTDIAEFTDLSYNSEKAIRKCFVALLILHYFELSSASSSITSFYELWNISFPNQQQVKKKLSKFDVARTKEAQSLSFSEVRESIKIETIEYIKQEDIATNEQEFDTDQYFCSADTDEYYGGLSKKIIKQQRYLKQYYEQISPNSDIPTWSSEPSYLEDFDAQMRFTTLANEFDFDQR